MNHLTYQDKDLHSYHDFMSLSTHYYAHSLNLTCGNWIKNSTIVSNSLDTSYEITKLVKFSPKRDSHLCKIREEEYYENEEKLIGKMQTLRLFSQTRWTVKASSLTSICENCKEFAVCNWCLVEYKDREAKARIKLRCKHLIISSSLGLALFL